MITNIIMEGSNMEKQIQSDRLALSVPEMGKALGISRSKAYQLVNREDFPSVRLGSRVIIPIEGLREWLNRGGTDAKHTV